MYFQNKVFVYVYCRPEDAGRYMNDRNGTRFQRSQSQNDLDQQAYNDRFFSPTDFRSSVSGFNIQRRESQHEPDQVLRRRPSDVGDRYRRSHSEWDGARMPAPIISDSRDISRTDDIEHRRHELEQKPRPPSDPSQSFEGSRYRDHRDVEYRREYDGRHLAGAPDNYRCSHENVAEVSGMSQNVSVRNANPKNQDIINWLKHGDDSDSQPPVSDYRPGVGDFDHSRSVNDRRGEPLNSQSGYRTRPSHAELSATQSYPTTRTDGEAALQNSSTSGLRDNKEETFYPPYRVSNPAYEAGHRMSTSEQTHSSDGSVRGKGVVGQQQGYSWSEAQSHNSFSSNTRWPNADPFNRSSQGQGQGMGYAPPEQTSPGGQHAGSSQILPPKPIHSVVSNSSAAHRSDLSEDLPPSLPPKLANQQAPLKPPHVSPVQLDWYQHSADDLSRTQTLDHRLQRSRDDSVNHVDSAVDYAVVHKRHAQYIIPGQAVGDSSWHHEVEEPGRPRANGVGYPSDMTTSRSRQSPDGTLDTSHPPVSTSNPAIQPLTVNVTSSADLSKEWRPTTNTSSQEDLTSVPPVRPPFPSDQALAVSGILEDPSTSRSEPQAGAENIDPQVNTV